MDIRRAAGSIGALYAHAIAMEREAAARYREFAQSMRDHGNDAMGELFERLAAVESAHADRLERETRNVAIPIVDPSEYAWIEAGSPEAGAREFVLRMMTPFDALKIALAAEERARHFFAEVLGAAVDAEVKSLAMEMLADEADHIEWVKEALEHAPRPAVDWEQLFARRGAEFPPGRGVEIVVGAGSATQHGRPSHMKHAPVQRKPAAKRAKKPAARKGAAKKAAVGKPGAKKAAAKRAGARKAAAKKAAARKTGRPGKKRAAGARKPAAKSAARKAATKTTRRKAAAKKK
jgi:rubrerythrin